MLRIEKLAATCSCACAVVVTYVRTYVCNDVRLVYVCTYTRLFVFDFLSVNSLLRARDKWLQLELSAKE